MQCFFKVKKGYNYLCAFVFVHARHIQAPPAKTMTRAQRRIQKRTHTDNFHLCLMRMRKNDKIFTLDNTIE